jgi:hypothetical protein
MTRPRSTTPGSGRQREGWGVLAVIVLAAISGLLAAHFGTHRAWENPSASTSTSTSTSVPFVDPQRIP